MSKKKSIAIRGTILVFLCLVLVISPASAVTPDDPYYENNAWHLHGESSTSPGISAETAWDISTGDNTIIVAVIDDGIDLEHPDLKDNIWTNTKEIPGNGIDDDGNGYIDDIHGWNFVTNTTDVNGYGNHGTYCAGVIGAVGNNSEGIAGICWNVQIMPVVIYDLSGYSVLDIYPAVKYAVDNGAKIINFSSGSDAGAILNRMEKSDYIKSLEYARSHGVLFVNSAGNEGENIDVWSVYPAAYNNKKSSHYFDNMLVAAASDENDRLADFSNYGKKTVDIAAPGTNIFTTSGEVHVDSVQVSSPELQHLKVLGDNDWSVNEYDELYISGSKRSFIYNADSCIPLDSSSGNDVVFSYCAALNIRESSPDCGLYYILSDKPFDAYSSFDELWDALDKDGGTAIFDSRVGDSEDYYDEYSVMISVNEVRDLLQNPDADKCYAGVMYVQERGYDSNYAGVLLFDVSTNYRITGHSYESVEGTSFSAPMVSGAAALLYAVNPSLTYTEVKEILKSTADTSDEFKDKVSSGGRLNLSAAVKKAASYNSAVDSEKYLLSYAETDSETRDENIPASPAALFGCLAGLSAAAYLFSRGKK